MLVAQIAYNHLDSVVKTKCDALIAVALANNNNGTSNFVTASVWADDFKTQLGTGTEHYIDLPISLDGTATNGVASDSDDVVRAIRQCIITLQNTNAVATNRATSLRYLLHFVGDIQQPLHSSTAVWSTKTGGDSGGNGFSITGDWSNLHSLWDSGGGFLGDFIPRPFTVASFATLSNKVVGIETDYPFTGNPGAISDPMDWAVEGKNVAQTVTYVNITRSTAPTTNYLNSVIATTEQRMAIGGKRLADLLNTIFAATPVGLTPVPVASGNFSFSWSASAGKTFRVQWKSQLTDITWNDLADVAAAGSSAAYTNSAAQTQRFYRVVSLN